MCKSSTKRQKEFEKDLFKDKGVKVLSMSEGDKEKVTADSIILGAYEGRDPQVQRADYRLDDIEELRDYQLGIRTSYEKLLQFKRTDIPQYIRYAKWEWELHNYARARSIFERALGVDHSNIKLWLSYIHLEIESSNLNHARNLLERTLLLLPRVDKFYYEYILLELNLKNFNNVKEIYQRWINWKPTSHIYGLYIKFLIKYKDYDQLRVVYEDLIKLIPNEENFLAFIGFEIKYGTTTTVRQLFEMIIENLIRIDKIDEYLDIIIKYLDFEIEQSNIDKLRLIYKFALSKTTKIYKSYTDFEKIYGDKSDIEYSVLVKRKLQYEQQQDLDLDDWWSYFDVLEKLGELNKSVFQKSLDKLPICEVIWLRYLYYLELTEKDIETTRSEYKKYIKLNSQESWIKFAEFEIRQGDLTQLRKILGIAMGKLAGASLVLDRYVDLEIKLRQFDRVRKIMESYLSKNSMEFNVWIKFIEFETKLGEISRLELIWEIILKLFKDNVRYLCYKKYLNFLHENLLYEKTRVLYERLLEVTNWDVNVYIAYLMNELLIPTDEQLAKIHNGEIDEFDITDTQITKLQQVFTQGLKKFQPDEEKLNSLFENYKGFIAGYKPTEYDEIVRKGPVEKMENSFMDNARKWMLQQEQKG